MRSVAALGAQQRAQDAAEEPERDRDDARVGERPADRRAGVGVGARPDLRRDDDQEDRRDDAERHAADRAGRVEAPPGEREQQRREVGARGDREREADHERDVQALAADDRDQDRDARRSTPRRSCATQTSSSSESWPLRMMFDQTSCATAPDARSTRPATTARIVAKATPAITARNRSPPNVPAPPPSSAARFGAARLPPVPAASTPRLAQERARAEADERRQQVEAADQEHGPDHRAARGLGVRDGEEAHQDVRQAGGAEHQREAERDGVDRRGQERARARARTSTRRSCSPRPR